MSVVGFCAGRVWESLCGQSARGSFVDRYKIVQRTAERQKDVFVLVSDVTRELRHGTGTWASDIVTVKLTKA